MTNKHGIEVSEIQPPVDPEPHTSLAQIGGTFRTRFAAVALLFAIAASAFTQKVPGVVIDHQSASTGQFVGSPSIVIAPNGNYIATHDLFGPGSPSTTSAETKVFVSEDRGSSWKQVASFHEQFWSNLFVLKGRIYLMGSSAEFGRIVIRTSENNGQSWSSAHYLTDGPGFHTAPVPVVIHGGRIYRAFEYHPAGPWGSFQAFMMSASVGSDLISASSWTFSDRQSFPISEFGDTWLEGNAVLAPDGSILDILRVNNTSHAAILKLNGTNLKLDRFVDFPGGATKFSIRFDPVSKLYWALVNPALPGEAAVVTQPGSIRNTVALMSSSDLTHWTPRSIVLHHPEVQFHAFQYVDWQFDGNDLILASRTAFDDGAGGANNFHNANYLTFHRVRAFRTLGTVKLAGSHFANAEVASASQIKNWTATTADDAAKSQDGVFSQAIGRYGNHTTTLTTRTKTGDAEQHRDWCDVFVAVSGEASLVSGGHLADARTTTPGELRGSAIIDGKSRPLQPGAIVHIDPQIPHQLVVPPGKSFTYFVVKVEAAATR